MTNNGALVSVIVPVYGTEAYLPSCIESIQGQTYENIQIILVDDQSPDQCPDICDNYAKNDSRIIVIHQKNTGVSGARNTGIRYATGDYVMFVDSDDVLYDNAVETLLQDAIAYNADIVSASKRIVDEKGAIISSFEDGTYTILRGEDSLLLSLAGERSTNSVWAKLYKASFIQELRFEEGRNIHEDGFFLFQCFLKKPVMVQHNVIVYQYNTRRGSSSRQNFSEKYLSMLYFCERKKELIAKEYPQHAEHVHNMEVRTNLQLLDLLCSTTEKKFKSLQKQCTKTVSKLHKYHRPINKHHKLLAWVAAHGLYPLYKQAVRFKYYR